LRERPLSVRTILGRQLDFRLFGTNIRIDDAARATASIRDELPGHGKEMQKSAEESMARVGSTVGHAIDRAERTVDKSVEEGTSILIDKSLDERC
jgi:hypothetical protein